MRQRTKLAVALLALALVVGGVGFLGLESFRHQAFEQTDQQIQQNANVAANQTESALEGVERRLSLVATDERTENVSMAGNILRDFTDHSVFYKAVLIAPNGTIVEARGTFKNRRSVLGTSVRGEPYFEQPLSGTAAKVSEPFEINDSHAIIIGKPVRGGPEDDDIVGVVAGSVALDSQILSVAETLNTTKDTTVEVSYLDTDENIVVQPGDPFGQSRMANATVTKFGSTWQVTMIRDEQPLNERLGNLRNTQAASLLVVFLAIIGLGYWEYSTNLRQTERLLDGFARVREGDYAYTIDLSSATEWERISDGYNELTRGLAEREQALREREQQLEVLNRVLRHNLQNDMNVIIGHAEMLPRFSEDDRVKKSSETIVRMGEELVGHGQKARQLEAAMGRDGEPVEMDLADIVQTTVSQYASDNPDCDFEVDEPEQARARVDKSFEMALDNLLENAIEHNDAEDPMVHVSVAMTPDTVDVEIIDNGPGIPAHEYEVLEEGAETALQHGSGVGLWLAHWVVDSSEGTLAFDDRNPRGTRIEISVPAASSSVGATTTDVDESAAGV